MRNVSNSTAQTTVIIIDLEVPDSADIHDDVEQQIQREAYLSAARLVESTLLRIPSFCEHLEDSESKTSDIRGRVHDTIFVSGGRGSGKTTFLLNLPNQLRSPLKSRDSSVSKLEDLEALPILDPTQMELKEHILVNIIAAISRRVEKKYTASYDEKFVEWQKHLQALADGLKLLDSVGPDKVYGDDWEDSQWILQAGLKNAKSGFQLERHLAKFVRESLKLLGKPDGAFLLRLDDIDTSFDHGWTALEMIRKYLTTPQLVVVLAGDPELYSKLVRRHQFENLGSPLLSGDRPSRERHDGTSLPSWNHDPYRVMVGKLENQYLLKILPPENRIHMLTLGYYQAFLTGSYSVTVCGENKTAPAAEYMEKLLSNGFFVSKGSDVYSSFRSSILEQPLRTAIKVLRAGKKLGFREDTVVTSDRDEAHKEFLDRLTDIASSGLFNSELNPEDVKSANSRILLRSIRHWVTATNQWDEGYRLVPNYSDQQMNLVALTLGGQLAERIVRDPSTALWQLLSIGMLRELTLSTWPQGEDQPSPDAISDYLGLELDDKASTLAGRIVSCLRILATAPRGPSLGTIPIYASEPRKPLALRSLYGTDVATEIRDILGSVNRRTRWLGNLREAMAQRIQSAPNNDLPGQGVLYNDLASLSKHCGDLGVFVGIPASINASSGGGGVTTFSIFNLLGALADLMSLESSDDIEPAFLRLGQMRTYPRPPWARSSGYAVPETPEPADPKSTSNEPDQNDGTSTEDPPNTPDSSRYIRAFREWFDHLKSAEHPRYHPHIYARMTTRFYYSLSAIDSSIDPGNWYSGYVLHRWIVAFLNAILVEECLAIGGTNKLRVTNAVTSDTEFYYNLISRTGSKDEQDLKNKASELPPFFKTIASCPLWAIYVLPSTEVRESPTARRGPSWNILEFFESLWLTQDHSVTEVSINLGTSETSNVQSFRNLYYPLNTIPVWQGDQARTTGAARTIKKA